MFSPVLAARVLTRSPIVLTEHRNGLMNDWGFYSTNGASHLNREEYMNARPITTPAHIWDYDRPVNAVGAFVRNHSITVTLPATTSTF